VGDASAVEGMVSLYLKNMSDKAIGKILVSVSTMAQGKQVVDHRTKYPINFPIMVV
jgi:hypothetical protein